MVSTVNLYSRYVANKVVDGKHCTVLWYVSDLKVSYEDVTFVRSIMDTTNKIFPGLICNAYKNHTYLVMKIKWNKDKSVTIDMKYCVKETVIESEMSICINATSPDKHDLLDIDDNFIGPAENNIFHNCVAKILYVSQGC